MSIRDDNRNDATSALRHEVTPMNHSSFVYFGSHSCFPPGSSEGGRDEQ
jgi:hypothetical protein